MLSLCQLVIICCFYQDVIAHALKNKPFSQLPTANFNNFETFQRKLTSKAFRMTFDTTHIELNIKNLEQKKLLLQTLEIARFFYTELIEPIFSTPDRMHPSNSMDCNYNFTAKQIVDGEQNSDFHFYIRVESSPETWIASSQPCLLQSIDNRPIMGIITINSEYLKTVQSSSDFSFQSYVDLFIHEMFHSIVFSSQLFPYFINLKTKQPYPSSAYNADLSKGKVYVAFPRVVEWAQKHYSCDQINYFPLEDGGGEGSIGSHWERTLLQNDIMTASQLPVDNLWSGINNALLEDSGWYRMAPTAKEDTITWGLHRGCQFFFQTCNGGNFREFCRILGERENTFNSDGLGLCTNSDIFSKCPYSALYQNVACVDSRNKLDPQLGSLLYSQYFANFSATSRSFISSLSPVYIQQLHDDFTMCYSFKCSRDFKQIEIQIGEDTATCSKDSQIISKIGTFQLNGRLICPSSIFEFCLGSSQLCPSFCGQQGFCLDGKCHCLPGLNGIDPVNCSCSTGYFLNDQKTCESCQVENCETCKQPGICVLCSQGYFASNSTRNSCQKCPSNCMDCSQENGKCLKCKANHIMSVDMMSCMNFSFIITQSLIAVVLFAAVSF